MGAVAAAALPVGEAGLPRFAIRLVHPVQPMFATTPGDIGQALDTLGEEGLEDKPPTEADTVKAMRATHAGQSRAGQSD